MSGIAIGSIMFAIMLSLMIIRVPIGIAMFMVGAGAYVYLTGGSIGTLLNSLKNLAYARLSNYDLVVIPLFMLMGQFATHGGLSRLLFRFVETFLGHRKGGVGQSPVSANLAVALARLGAGVGLIDADVYGPSIPTLMGATAPPAAQRGAIVPVLRYGVKIVSIGFFVPKGEATIWRGPMLAKLIDKFLGGVEWGELDYLLVDLPPGTGDVQLSLCQKIPLTGAAVVSTPQDLAFNVAERAIFMFTKLRTPVLGLVENMSGFECRHCGHREEIFGSGGARRFAAASGIPFLGAISLSTDIRMTSDEGNPIVQSMPESLSARAFGRVAENLAAQVSTLTLGGVSSDRPEIAEITRPSENEVRILWKDGHESIYTGYALRVGCRCALCVDEISGNKRLREESISKDVRPLSIDPVGRYAIRFHWSDGHSTGIYTFEHLRELCPCPICADNAEARTR